MTTVRPTAEPMPDTAPPRSQAPRRPWIAPTLTRHESLSAMTQQYYPPQPYPPGHPGNLQFGTFADTIPGSAGVFI